MKVFPQHVACLLVFICVGNPVAQGAIVAHLKFDDGTGSSTAADSSGFGHNGTLTDMDPVTDWVPGVIGGALDFNTSPSTDDYVVVPDDNQLDFGAGNFTVSFWVNKRAGTTGGYNNLWGVNKWNTGGSPNSNEWSLTLGTESTDEPSFTLRTSSAFHAADSSTPLTLNTWHHLVGVRRGGMVELYQDGVLTASDNTIGTLAVLNAGRDLRIATSNVERFNPDAIFDDLGILNHAWEAGEIAAVRNLALNSALNYDLSQAQTLFDLYDTGNSSNSVNIGGRTWRFTDGLNSGIGVVEQIGGNFAIQLDSSGYGVSYSVKVPEPNTLSMFLLGVLFIIRRRRH